METNVLKGYLQSLRVGKAVKCRNLAVVPLLGGLDAPPEYQTLDEALAAGTLAVSEVSAAGQVPELMVKNAGSRPVLMLDGEELVGAKQNRILNLTILVPAETTAFIPVSCVEQGRWRSVSAQFASGNYAPASLRSNKERTVRESLRATGAPVSDQGQVWDDVEATLHCVRASSPTMAMASAYRQREAELRRAAETLHLPEGACGAAAFVGRELVVVDLFGYQSTFRQVSRKLIASYVLAALAEPAGTRSHKKALSVADFRRRMAETLGRGAAAALEERPSVGLGTDVRLTGAGIRGAALVCGQAPLHASLFPDDGVAARSKRSHGSRMASPRRRRSSRDGGRGIV